MDTMKESLEKNPKNPMQLSPVIECVIKFLKLKDIKTCRLVSREWGSIGKVALGKRAIIRFRKSNKSIQITARDCIPSDFQSRFLNSATLFSAFRFEGYLTKNDLSSTDPWTMEELKSFFDEHQNYIKELQLRLVNGDEKIMQNFEISSWILKTPMVQKDAKYMTKLQICEGDWLNLDISSVKLIAHIKDLSLSDCKINIEEGIRIFPIKLHLSNVTFFQNGIILDRVRINNFVDFSKLKEIWLDCKETPTKYVVDLLGNTTVDKMSLHNCEIVHGEISEWVIEHLETKSIPYSLNNRMKIKELCLSLYDSIDLFTLPNSIQKLALQVSKSCHVSCSQPIVLENLQYLNLFIYGKHDFNDSVLPHFMNCPKMTHLRLRGEPEIEMKSLWMPKSVKTLTLQDTVVNWVDHGFLNLDKLIVHGFSKLDEKFFMAKIRVQDLVVNNCGKYVMHRVDKELVEFLERRNRSSLEKRLYIGGFNWDQQRLEDSILKEHVHDKSSFYVFENEGKGRAVSEDDFNQLIPKHLHWEIFPTIEELL